MKTVLRKIRRKLFYYEFSRRYRCNLNPDLKASQGGEDGIIRELLRRLGIDKGWFVEFGAWDGILYSNTFALAQKDWHGVYIEGDPEKAEELHRNMKAYPNVIPLCHFISLEDGNRLDEILAWTDLPREFDLLSIDIDGNDYWIWKSLTNYEPKIVVIEYNSNFGPRERKTIPYDATYTHDGTMYHGASAAALNALGVAKGYTLIAYTRKLNLFFVRNDLIEGRFKRLDVTKVPVGEAKSQRRREDFITV